MPPPDLLNIFGRMKYPDLVFSDFLLTDSAGLLISAADLMKKDRTYALEFIFLINRRLSAFISVYQRELAVKIMQLRNS